ISYDSDDVEFFADMKVELDAKSAQSFIELWDAVEELDDVQNVYANVEITAEVLEELSAQDANVQDRSRRSQPVSQLRVCAADPGLTRCGSAVVDLSG